MKKPIVILCLLFFVSVASILTVSWLKDAPPESPILQLSQDELHDRVFNEDNGLLDLIQATSLISRHYDIHIFDEIRAITEACPEEISKELRTYVANQDELIRSASEALGKPYLLMPTLLLERRSRIMVERYDDPQFAIPELARHFIALGRIHECDGQFESAAQRYLSAFRIALAYTQGATAYDAWEATELQEDILDALQPILAELDESTLQSASDILQESIDSLPPFDHLVEHTKAWDSRFEQGNAIERFTGRLFVSYVDEMYKNDYNEHRQRLVEFCGTIETRLSE